MTGIRRMILALLPAAASLPCACSTAEVPPPPPETRGEPPAPQNAAQDARSVAPAASFTLTQRELLSILEEQERLARDFKAANRPESELKSRLSVLEQRWADYMRENSQDANSLILFGKFLRSNGDAESAYKVFRQADELEPGIAVIKQQLATFEGENKMYAQAYAHLKDAVRLEPQTAVYARQLGDFLYMAGDRLEQLKVLTRETRDSEMLSAFGRAAALSPNDAEAAVRFAQAFYDVKNPDWPAALEAWRAAEKLSALNVERDSVRINIAAVLLEMGRPGEAAETLGQISSPGFEGARAELMKSAQRMAAQPPARQTNAKTDKPE